MDSSRRAPTRRSTRGRGRLHVHGSGGFSLLEALIALVLTSLLLVGIAQGLFVTVKVSGENRTATVASVRLNAVVERMKALAIQGDFYKSCATADQVQQAVVADPGSSLDGATLHVDSVTYWNVDGYVAACPTGDKGAQLVKLTVTAGDDHATGIVALRRPTATP